MFPLTFLWRIGIAVILALPALCFAVGESVNGFPNWEERVLLEWTNRARSDPQVEMTACGANCAVDAACYNAIAPLSHNLALNRSARFHADEMRLQGYFDHPSACTVVANIDALYPATCDGSASCACQGGVEQCTGSCTEFFDRIQLFGALPVGEAIAEGTTDPNAAFNVWLRETGVDPTCDFTADKAHRWLILKEGPALGGGFAGTYSVLDFGQGSAPTKIPSGAHYPRQAAAVEVWANWYDAAGPSSAEVNVDGACQSLTRARGTQSNGAWTTTLTNVASGCHRYYFSFRDAGNAVVTYPTTGSLGIGPAGSCAAWESTRPQACGGVVAATLDIDGSNVATRYDALTDGLLVIRYMFGLTGASLTNGAVGGTATRTTPDTIKAYLDSIRQSLDIDGEGNVDALTDGLLILRYLFGLRGATLIQNAFVSGAPRSTATLIENYLGTLTPP